ncbi:hypothetical protein PLICRDRAFT_36752 [Plicaturopsis crispa FD-325 SS-3]|nr:hypothetical protein PLICRDRAFT_36752 [Plicaturopsis crispa FD-325 SS-3]
MDEEESNGWQLTESDPGVFTELLKTLGVPFIVDDLYSLDPDSLASLQPLHALIFLFKWVSPSASNPNAKATGQPDAEFPGFFANQVVNNACATLAVINALGNIPSLPSTIPDSPLQNLLEFGRDMDPHTRGYAVVSADWLREAHNALSPPSAVSLDGLGLPKGEKEDAYHFVVYLPVAGAVWELDGLQQHPIRHGSYDEKGEGWLATAREVVEARIGTYPMGALEFSLLALRDDPLPSLQARLAHLQETGGNATDVIVKLANENAKRERWAFENSLRKHNHLGLVHALVLALAKAGKLDAAKESAKKVMQQRLERRREVGMEED